LEEEGASLETVLQKIRRQVWISQFFFFFKQISYMVFDKLITWL
jgi:hypothetical protein